MVLPNALHQDCFLQCCVYLEANWWFSLAAQRKISLIPQAVLQQNGFDDHNNPFWS